MLVELAHNRVATEDDIGYVVSLMRKNRESVGGLPKPAIMERIVAGTLVVQTLNDDPIGYIMYDIGNRTLRIPQACIQYDARRKHHGVSLFFHVLGKERHRIDEIRLRCAADLEANVFWKGVGMTCVGFDAGGTRRGRTINLWRMWLGDGLFPLMDISQPPCAELRSDAMYDDSGFLLSAPDGFRPAIVLPKLAWANRRKT